MNIARCQQNRTFDICPTFARDGTTASAGREVRDIMFSWMRPVAVLTSQFFLSDEEGELEMPLRINGGRSGLQLLLLLSSEDEAGRKSRAGCKPLGLPPYN